MYASAISIIRGEIVDDLSDIRIVDRRAVDLDHLGHFRLPEILLEFFAARLRLDVIGGVTGGAIVLHRFEIGAGLEGGGLFRKRVGDRLGAAKAEAAAEAQRRPRAREEFVVS